jgi:hypothetical protein
MKQTNKQTKQTVLPSFRHHQFPFIILVTVAHIQLIWIYHQTIQVKFEFGHGPMIFDRVIALDEIFNFLSLSPKRYYTFKGMRRSTSNLVMVRWSLIKIPFYLVPPIVFSFRAHAFFYLGTIRRFSWNDTTVSHWRFHDNRRMNTYADVS